MSDTQNIRTMPRACETQRLNTDELRAAFLVENLFTKDKVKFTFTDLDLASYPQPPGSILPLFAQLGLVTVDLAPKPALDAWDDAYARPYSAGSGAAFISGPGSP